MDYLALDFARPRPAADVADALVVDRDDGDAVRGLARGAGAGVVVVAPLQRADEVRGLVQDDHGDDDEHTHEPVGAPELPARC